MKKIIRVLAVIAVVFLCDILVGLIGDWYINSLSNYSFFKAQMCNVMLNKEADILIIGASKANHSYITEEFASDSISAFNAGIDASDCYAANMVLRSLISRRKPQLVVFDIADRQVEVAPNNIAGLFAFLYGKSEPIDSLLSAELSLSEKIKLHCNLYRYNKMPETVASFFHSKNKTANGYVPLYGRYEGGKFVTKEKFSPNEKEVYYLEDLMNICKQNGIELVISVSPACINNTAFNSWLDDLCKENHIHLINTNTLFWNNLDLFHDDMHLNQVGAIRFTEFLLDSLRTEGIIG